MDAPPLKPQSDKQYYANTGWDVESWVDVISIEYEQLIETYPFGEKLQRFSGQESIRLLDVGCGTAIFPAFLDARLPQNLNFVCDLLDISAASLEEAAKALNGLEHFSVSDTHEALIEDIPKTLLGIESSFDVIWAMHSFTTVDLKKMPAVYAHLIEALAPNGCFFIYQLAAEASYQKLHGYYRAHHPNGANTPRFMQFEDTKSILDSLGAEYEVYELQFSHRVNEEKPDVLEKYLQKCVLDDSVGPEFFEPLLADLKDVQSGNYVFPQNVNFVVVSK